MHVGSCRASDLDGIATRHWPTELYFRHSDLCFSDVILAAGVEVEQGVCSYGDLPGYWNPVANRTVGNWTLLDKDCQLEVSAHNC